MDVILFGPPGAGKGTQAGATSQHLKVPHVATGDIFRRHLKEGTPLGQLAQGYMSQGQLVPDEVVVDIVASRLDEEDAKGGVLFDGFPRTVQQAILLEHRLSRLGRQIDAVINLVVEDAVVVGRLSGRRTCLACGATYHVVHNPPKHAAVCDVCGAEVVHRDDDQAETIQRRLEAYHAQTAPVLAWLRERSFTVDVDADQPIEAVQAVIRHAVHELPQR